MSPTTRVVDLEITSLAPGVSFEAAGLLRAAVRLHGEPLAEVTLPSVGGTVTALEAAGAIASALFPAIVARLATRRLARAPLDPDTIASADVADDRWRDTARRADLDELLRELDREPAGSLAVLPAMTIAVCTRERPDDLARCLAALAALEYPRPLDVLVIDNAPRTELTATLVREHFPGVRYVAEPRPGLDWARNRAIIEARGEIIAFTDDDVLVDPGWARALAEVFAAAPEVAAVTGSVLPSELTTAAQQQFEAYGGFLRGWERRWYRVPRAGGRSPHRHHGAGQFGTGANMAFRRSLFDAIGGFDPALDAGTATNGAGDLEMFFRVLQEGYTLVYAPEALVRHRHRSSHAELLSQLRSWGSGYVAYHLRSAAAYPEERREFGRQMRWVCGYFLRRLAFAALGLGGLPRALALAEIRGALAGRRLLATARTQAAAIEAAFPGLPTLPVPSGPVRGDRAMVGAVAVRTVAVDGALRAIDGLAGYARIRLVLTRGGRPFGQIDLIPEGDTVSVLQLGDAIARVWTRALLAGDGRAEARAAVSRWLGKRVSPPVAPSVSVLVPTLDRPDDLRTCLAGLAAQRYDGRLEVVVVDNAPASGLTPPVVADFPGVRLVSEPRRGASYARNAGIRASTGEICAMTDDDVRVAPDWLGKLVAPFARPDVALVTGNVLPLELETAAQQQFEHYGGLGRGFVAREFDRQWLFRSWKPAATWEIGGTANAAIRIRSVVRPDVGLMPEWLGPGTPTGVGEDTYLFYRVLAAGLTIVYDPTAVAWHRHRRDDRALRRQLYAYSTGHVAYFLALWLRDGDGRGFLQLGAYLPVHHLRNIGRWIAGDRRWPASLIATEIEGNLAGPWLLWRSVRRARRLAR